MVRSSIATAAPVRAAACSAPSGAPGASEPLPTEGPPAGPLHPLLAYVIEAGPYARQWASLVRSRKAGGALANQRTVSLVPGSPR